MKITEEQSSGEHRVVLYPDPQLRQIAAPIRELSEDLYARVHSMWPIMYEEGGIGLAAPQVGWNVRLFLLNLDGPGGQEVVLLNPTITRKNGLAVAPEGCLSLPGVVGNVCRAEMIYVVGRTLDGKEVGIETGGLAARCIQHELDHLDGKLMIDHFSEVDLRKNAKILEKLKKSWIDKHPDESTEED